MSIKTIYLLPHSHTDIGYTEYQKKIELWQIDFIRQVLRIQDSPEYASFKWNCESFWVVEKFLRSASPDEKLSFVNAVREEKIGVSASYLNFSEILDFDLLKSLTKRSVDWGKSNGINIDTAMTADINGYGWGFARVLSELGVKNLFSCVHTHHGMFPAFAKQRPFWWEESNKDRILVWNGEHYHFGNEFGIAPDAGACYLIKDEFDLDHIFHKLDVVMKTRIPRYIENLEKEGYPFDFAPVMISGLRTDNSPPGKEIVKAISVWNAKNDVKLELITLSDFFSKVDRESTDIPVYHGDWPDWWTDGAASKPAELKLYKSTQRKRNLMKKIYGAKSLKIVDEKLGLYAEHTYGHSDSVSQPWNEEVSLISTRKNAYITEAIDILDEMQYKYELEHGGSALQYERTLKYMICNLSSESVNDLVYLKVNHFEINELYLNEGADIIDCESGEKLNYSKEGTPGGVHFVVKMELAGKSERMLEIIPVKKDRFVTVNSYSLKGSDGIDDIVLESKLISNSYSNDRVKIFWSFPGGITSILDTDNDIELINQENDHPLFTPVYDVTPVKDINQMCSVRSAMGRNRKGKNFQQHSGKLNSVDLTFTSDLYDKLQFDYEIEGARFYRMILTVHNYEGRIDVNVIMHKDSIWEPENMYLSIPLQVSNSEIFLCKAGEFVQPLKDQLPGTCIDYYSVEHGILFSSDSYGIGLRTPDTSLLQLGDLRHKSRILFNGEDKYYGKRLPYIWLMTNYWETNFAAELGGFHKFNFNLLFGKDYTDNEVSRQRMKGLSESLIVVRQKTD